MSPPLYLADVLGPARYQPYRDAACGDEALAVDLYLWGTELAGAWHSHLSFVEVAVRNSLDRQLRDWNSRQTRNGVPLPAEWTGQDQSGRMLYQLMGRGIEKAREWATDEAKRRETTHPRHGAVPHHDDVVAQLTFGSWSRLLRFPGRGTFTPRQRELWNQSLKCAFPYASQDDSGLLAVGGRMESLRALRNRVAHHENLLQVNTIARLNSSLTLLAWIDPGLPDLVMARNTLRRLNHEDPRRRRLR